MSCIHFSCKIIFDGAGPEKVHRYLTLGRREVNRVARGDVALKRSAAARPCFQYAA